MELGAILGSGWASGLNLYGVVALLGISGRMGWIDSPVALRQWWVIGIAAFLFAIEFVADKVPVVDSLWDSVHTFVRPLGAAMLAMVLAGEQPTAQKLLIAFGSGSLALTSHGAKATTRLAANTSPEPFSNIGLSVIEDVIMAAMIWLVAKAPVAAGIIAVVLAIICVLIIWRLWRFAKRLFRRRETVRVSPHQ
jgi:Domain of unknown function (DUF4126)